MKSANTTSVASNGAPVPGTHQAAKPAVDGQHINGAAAKGTNGTNGTNGFAARIIDAVR